MRPSPRLLQKASANAVPVHKKYTVQSYGIWEFLRRTLSLDPNRSTGVPINAQFRFPTPGALPPQSYDDPVTLPASDLADNPYWKRDVRRNYPQLSVLKQADVVGLLTVGSKAAPKEEVLKLGDAGNQQLVEIKETAEERGLAAFFQDNGKDAKAILGPDGLPPSPPNLNPSAAYTMETEQSYESSYPCRSFV